MYDARPYYQYGKTWDVRNGPEEASEDEADPERPAKVEINTEPHHSDSEATPNPEGGWIGVKSKAEKRRDKNSSAAASTDPVASNTPQLPKQKDLQTTHHHAPLQHDPSFEPPPTSVGGASRFFPATGFSSTYQLLEKLQEHPDFTFTRLKQIPSGLFYLLPRERDNPPSYGVHRQRTGKCGSVSKTRQGNRDTVPSRRPLFPDETPKDEASGIMHEEQRTSNTSVLIGYE